jgi:8-oxo-dGTP pyrophosphatase MutT (NUDIX family)
MRTEPIVQRVILSSACLCVMRVWLLQSGVEAAAVFGACLIRALTTQQQAAQLETSVLLNEIIDDHRVVLTLTDSSHQYCLPLGHAATLSSGRMCPADSSACDSKSPKLAACAIIEDSEGRILLTRRAAHMRIFPRAWVLPGGGVDPGESLTAAAAREVHEETGIALTQRETQGAKTVALWESCYPITAADGPLKGHHLVAYVSFALQRAHTECSIQLQPEEVDACYWISKSQLATLLQNSFAEQFGDDSSPPVASSVDSGTAESEMLQSLTGIYGHRGSEGIAEGHAWALQQFLKNKQI